MRRALVLVVAGLVMVSSSALASPLHVDGKWLRDADGGVVILRGVNAAGNSKVPPFRPLTDAAMFDPLEGWGMNVVRLLFTWEAYEPAAGVYDESYLDYIVAAVDAAESRGLYVIVDFHQDGFSRFTLGGCGEGFPSWTIPWWVIKSTPANDSRCTGWGAALIFDIGMHIAWASFHGDAIGARTRYLKMLERVATRLASHDAVIGYDMMNEPWGDEATDIRRLHDDAALALRRGHPGAVLFVSPHCLISAGGKTNLKKPSFGNFVYAPHFYDAGVVAFHSWGGGSLAGPFGNMRGVADAWGVPLLVGEFGAPVVTQNGGPYIAAIYDGLDVALASGVQWVYTPGWTPTGKDGWNMEDLSIADGAGVPRANFAPRAFPRRVAGTPTKFVVDTVGKKVELTWDHVPGTGSTQLYVPTATMFGTPGVTIETSEPGILCGYSVDVVECSAATGGVKWVRVRPGG